MGTRIDISVAQQQLSRRVRELAQQNRAQRVRREDQAKEDAELREAVNQGLAQASRRGRQRPGGNAADFGLDAAAESDRLGALGLRSGVPEYYFGPKVAATPRRGKSWLLVPSDAEFRVKTRGIRPFSLVQLGGQKIGYLPDSGPGGTPALYGTTEVNPGVDGELCYNPGIYSDGLYDFGAEPPGKSFTVEAMYKLPPYAVGSRGPFSMINFAFGQFNLRAVRTWSMEVLPSDGSGIPVTETVTPYSSVLFTGGPFHNYYSNDIEPYPTFDGYSFLQPLRVPGLATTEWRHFAIVQVPGPTEETRTLHYYWNGQRLATVSGLGEADEYRWERYTSMSFQLQYGNLVRDYDLPWQDYVVTDGGLGHGFRFTPRALYTGDTYTPPVSITALA